MCLSSLPSIYGYDPIKIYIFNPITDSCVYPDTILDDSYIGNQITVRTCPGEYVPATFVVRPNHQINSLVITTTNLTGPTTIPKENVDIRTVKCWYQRGDYIKPFDPKIRVFLPGLLLKNDDLVKVTYIDMTHGWNQLKTSNGYININNQSEGSIYNTITDSPSLLPVKINANTNKQFWITIYVPRDIKEGVYTGTITLSENEITLSIIQISVEVLPFTLPEESIVEYSFYYTKQYINDTPTLGPIARSKEQLNAEFKNLKDHGITNPIIYQNYTNSPTNFGTYMNLRQAEGMKLDHIYYLGYSINSLHTTDFVRQTVTGIKDWFQQNYNTSNVYIYTEDEEDSTRIALQILAARDAGVKTFCAQGASLAIKSVNYDPPLLDLCILAGAPMRSIIDAYHNKNLRIGSYANPQAGEERPLTYRRNYGLLLWQFDVDVSADFGYAYGYGNLWNDWNWPGKNIYKQHVMAYPTTNGVVDTIQWEGWREGANDVRYLTKLLQVIDEAKKEGKYTSLAENYLLKLKDAPLINAPTKINLDTVRNDITNHILILQGYPEMASNNITNHVLEIPRYTQPHPVDLLSQIIIASKFSTAMLDTYLFYRSKIPTELIILSPFMTLVIVMSAVIYKIKILSKKRTPGFWKNNQDQWNYYSPTQTIKEVFKLPTEMASLNVPLLDAISFKGGEGTEGMAQNLLRNAVAAVLNDAHPEIQYPIPDVIDQVNSALASLNPDAMETLKNTLNEANNLNYSIYKS